ncbi:MAG: hypothetical protein IT288_13650 [Bdellovibrionales bacterium]|nr:hypothetical protein [Bdellovibrionales bacterium]
MSLLSGASLRFMQLNTENLFLYMDSYRGQNLQTMTEDEWQKCSTAPTPNKSLRKTWALAETIREINPDIIMLNEVGGEESLRNFNQYFLSNAYRPFIIEGNSDRGIDLAYLVRDDQQIQYLVLSHKNRPINFLYPHEKEQGLRSSHYFSRDVLELRVFRKGEFTPRLICLLVHLKSKLDPDGWDAQGRGRREAELKTLIRIYNEIQTEMQHQVPIIIGGDFNGIAHQQACEQEFTSIYSDSNLRELFDCFETPISEIDRTTQLQFLRDGSCRYLQLDYFFLSPPLQKLLDQNGCAVYRYKGDMGFALPLPTNLEQRGNLPSDHYPLIATFRNPLRASQNETVTP